MVGDGGGRTDALPDQVRADVLVLLRHCCCVVTGIATRLSIFNAASFEYRRSLGEWDAALRSTSAASGSTSFGKFEVCDAASRAALPKQHPHSTTAVKQLSADRRVKMAWLQFSEETKVRPPSPQAATTTPEQTTDSMVIGAHLPHHRVLPRRHPLRLSPSHHLPGLHEE